MASSTMLSPYERDSATETSGGITYIFQKVGQLCFLNITGSYTEAVAAYTQVCLKAIPDGFKPIYAFNGSTVDATGHPWVITLTTNSISLNAWVGGVTAYSGRLINEYLVYPIA